MSELQPGVYLGRYELLVCIGRGGMASVWVARERSAVSGKQRLVAVKAMLPELARHSEFRSMFLGEVQIIQSIQHDNVVRVFEVSEDRNILYMVMEWVEGDSLRNIIKTSRTHGALPPEIAVCIAADAAAGLHAAHELRDWDGELRGIVHCDVSPHNILVGMDGNAKLVDFGIANALGQLNPGHDTETIKGKLSYMSPEQALGEPVDRRTDVFALGIVLFELTTGEQLFKGRDVGHTLALVKNASVPAPTQLNPRYPRRLEQIVMKALDRDRARRFQSAEDFEYALSSYLTEEHAVVSHQIVANLLTRLMGSRIEKRREVISAVVAAIETQRATVMGSDHTPWFPEFPIPSDPTNTTQTGHSETGLGIAARLENTTASAVPVHRQPVDSPSNSLAWRWIGAFVVFLCVAATAGYYFLISRPRESSRTALAQLLAAESAVKSASTNSVTPSSSDTSSTTKHVDKALSVDSLPVDNSTNSEKPSVPSGGRSKKGKKGSNNKGSDNPADEDNAAATDIEPTKPAPADEKPAEEVPDEKPAAAAGIDRAAANSALASAAAAARACRSYGTPPSPKGRAAVTFSSDGSVIAVSISQNFIGTQIGNCALSHYRNARVPSFTGEATTIFSAFDMSD